ncbi:unnamed protein product [Hermetia illucens]|uniref:Uncharacterized protein n=1 Tax=Hermetia illucens TaxID=343691 RepID=A0A7R8YYD5_HERIL|nr:unnamed protein product [Hermetia illucens]
MLTINLFMPLFFGNSSNLLPIFNITYQFKDLTVFSTSDRKFQETAEYILSNTGQHEHTATMGFTRNSSVILRQPLASPFLLLVVLPADIFETVNIVEDMIERFQNIKIVFVLVEVMGEESDLVTIEFILTNSYLAYLPSGVRTSTENLQGHKRSRKAYLHVIFTLNGAYGIGLPEEEKVLIKFYQRNLEGPVFFDPTLEFPVPISGMPFEQLEENAKFGNGTLKIQNEG